jgi:hypothetical protein
MGTTANKEALAILGGIPVRETLRSADGLALGTITHPHPFFGTLSLYEWFALIGSHRQPLIRSPIPSAP